MKVLEDKWRKSDGTKETDADRVEEAVSDSLIKLWCSKNKSLIKTQRQ